MIGLLPRRLFASAVLALAPWLVGTGCGGSAPSPTGPQAEVFFEFDTAAVNEGIPTQVKIVANTAYEFHSFDIDIKVPHQNALLHSVLPSAPFDDNGILFVTPSYNIWAGEIHRIVDFRHGSSSATGLVELAEFTMIPHTGTASAVLEFTKVKIADASGEEFTVTPQNRNFTILE
ncbi:MAG: hypothetical protein VX246_06305 [Myxococcota bacterium]|nr:hypothetical protein [Myxococcota bacterium]